MAYCLQMGTTTLFLPPEELTLASVGRILMRSLTLDLSPLLGFHQAGQLLAAQLGSRRYC